MSVLQRAGALAWTANKLQKAAAAGEIAMNATDPATREQAAYDAATHIAEAVGVGIPLWFTNNALTATGLDRVFDSLKTNKSFEQYLKEQAAKNNIRDFGLGALAEWGLQELADWMSRNQLLDPLFDLIPRKYKDAKDWVLPYDPIILDLDGDGLETVGLNANIHFDHEGDGVLTKSGWAGSDDALLVWDRNANGSIDTGAELFGDFTPLPNGTLAPNGFAALAALDANGDGIIDASDPAFAELKLWRDVSQDGVSQVDEFITLAEAGIVSLNLANTLKNQHFANGNTLSREGSFTRADNSEGGMGEFRFAADTFDTKFAEQIEVPEDLKGLPTMGGAGSVRELQQAATLSGGLAGLLGQFQSATTRIEQKTLLDQLLTAWAGTSGMAKSLESRTDGKYRIQYEAFGNDRRSGNIDATAFAEASSGVSGSAALMTDLGGLYLSERYRGLIDEWNNKLYVLESFNGQYFFNVPQEKSLTDGANRGLSISAGGGTADGFPTLRVSFSQQQLDFLQQAYDSLKESVYGSLVMQTRLRPYLDAIELVVDDSGIHLDAASLNKLLAEKRAANPEDFLADLLDLDRYAGNFLSGTNWSGLTDFDQLIDTLPPTDAIQSLLDEFQVERFSNGDDTVYLTNDADIVLGGDGADMLSGRNDNDRLFGQGGDDRLDGGNGDDLLSGRAGDDVLYGGSGADTYVFGRGYGNDIISDSAEGGLQRDTMRLLGLTPADIQVTADYADNLVVTILDTGETLSVPANGYWWGKNGVGQYVFDDGTVWTHDDALRATVAVTTDNDDVIHGSSTSDAISGLTGNDVLIGNAGDDVIDGGTGDDLLIGSSGWDSIQDESGQRVVRNTTPSNSANGDDVYLFGKGDGHDTVVDSDYTEGNSDTLRFKEGVAREDLRFIRNGNDLVLGIRDSGDQVTLKQYFDEDWGGENGSHLIERIAFADGTALSFSDVQAILFAGSDAAETIIGSRAADHLTGQRGDDLLLGGAGRDVLEGSAGNDILQGGAVQDEWGQVYSGDGSGDVYRFGRGGGHDIIIEESWLDDEIDRVELEAGIAPSDVRLERVRAVEQGWRASDDLRITLRDSGETLTIKDHFNRSSRYAIEEIAFADGTVWGEDVIRSRTLLGEPSEDELHGFHERDDVIVGGAGNDVLDGHSGSDTYHFGLGDGQDVINERSFVGEDTLALAPGIAPADLTVRWTLQGDMNVTLPDGSRVTVRGQANPWSSEIGIEQLRFDGGTVWDRSELASRALAATAGDDAIVGSYDDDTLDGGAGNDQFENLGGYDTYRFGAGDGQDTIAGGYGRVVFKPGIGQNDVVFTSEGDDLIATVSVSGEAVRINDWLNNGQRIDRFEFDNGAHLNVDDVLAKLQVSEESEILYGSPGDDALAGTEKDSVLYGREGNDVLTGSAGRDQLHGEAGNDVLDGGADRDWLYGSEGDNTYLIAPGSGLDNASGASVSVANDVVVFAPGIRPENLSVQLGEAGPSDQPGDVGYTEVVVGIGGNDALLLRNHSGGDLGRGAIQRFRFDDGTEWMLADLIGHADGGKIGWQQRYDGDSTSIVGSQADDTIYDYTGQSVTVQARGNDDYIQVAAGNDLVSAGTGTDTVYTGQGDDLIAGEAGDDIIDAGAGDDVVVFNYGDGRDSLVVGDGVDTLSFGAAVTPAMLSVALLRDGQVMLLVDGDTGGAITLEGIRADNLPGDLERLQFIDAEGQARIFSMSDWLRANAVPLLGATEEMPLGFDGTGFELSSAAPMGGLEAVAYAQAGDLFAETTFVRNDAPDGDDVLYGTPTSDMLNADTGNDIVLGLAGNDTILGDDGNDLILGGDGHDVLDGGAGDDIVQGGRGGDQLSGGGGRDELYGEWGGDTYRYQLGDGDVIIEDDHRVLNWGYGGDYGGSYGGSYAVGSIGSYGGSYGGGYGDSYGGGYGGDADGGEGSWWYNGALVDDAQNILSFGPGIRPEDLRYSEQNGDLVIEFANQPGDRVILRGYMPERATKTRSVDLFRFADGTEIVADSIEPTGKSEMAGDEGGWLDGTAFADTLIGGSGDDVLHGQGGADRLVGGSGSDTYRIHKELGAPSTQTILAENWRAADTNRIELTGDINADDLRLEFDGRDLLLRLSDEGDAIRFVGFDPRAPSMQAPVAEISLPWSGTSLSFDDLLARGVRIIGTPDNDVLTGTQLSDWIEGLEADDTMSGGAGGDLYVIASDSGIDAIIDSEDGATPNVVVLPEGTTLDDVRLSYDGEGFLILDLGNIGNRIRLSGFDPENPLGPRAVERFRFGLDGEEIGYEELLQRGFDIFGSEGGDALKGTTLVDRVWGSDGNDLIESTPGGDWLRGEGGNDTYVVNLGDGAITIDDVAHGDAGNVLRFGPEIDPDALRNALRFEPDGSGGHVLLIPYGGAGDIVRLTGFDPADVLGSHAVDRFEFTDGTSVDYATLVSWTFVVEGDNGSDALKATNVGDRLYGYDGDDLMESGDGEDVLTGGIGSDVLRGGAGRDAYVVNLGDGADTIEDDLESGVGNALSFGESITREDVRVEADGNDLLIHYGNGGDVVRVSNYAPDGTGGGTVIDAFEFADSTTVTLREFMNQAPAVALSVDDQLLLEDAAFSLMLPDNLFLDADGDDIMTQVMVSGHETPPDWLQYDAGARTLYGTPENDDVGEFDVVVQGMDALGAASLHSFRVTVQNTNDAPEIGAPLPDQHALEDTTFGFALPVDSFHDLDVGDVLSYSATLESSEALPGWLSFDAQTQTFSGVPDNGDVGSLRLQITATDLAGESASQTFALDVVASESNPAPVTVPDAAMVIEDRKLLTWGNVLANDQAPENGSLAVADPGMRRGEYGLLTLLPNGGYAYLLDDLSAQVQGLAAGETVTDRFSYLATDGAGRSSGELAVTVQGTNDAPRLARRLADVQLAKGDEFSWKVPEGSFNDADRNDALAYTATLSDGKPLPDWFTFDPATQMFSGTAPLNASGSIDVRVTASDGHSECLPAADVFKVNFGKNTVVPSAQTGNEGLGNDQDAPPPGHDFNYNDGAGTSPGQPGRKEGSERDKDPIGRFLDGFEQDAKLDHGAPAPLDRNWFAKWEDRHPPLEHPRETGKNGDLERHWAGLVKALDRLDHERQSAIAWSHANQGADVSGLAGLMQGSALGARGGVDAISLAGGGGTQLKAFTGLSEGIGKLSG